MYISGITEISENPYSEQITNKNAMRSDEVTQTSPGREIIGPHYLMRQHHAALMFQRDANQPDVEALHEHKNPNNHNNHNKVDISFEELIERNLTVALSEGEQRYRLLIDAAPVMVWVSGTDGLCTDFNQPWLDFTGRTLEQELGEGWLEGVHAEDRRQCIDDYLAAFRERESFALQYRLRRADGAYCWVLDNGVPHYTREGGFLGYIGSCIDITESKHMREELARALLEVRQLKEQLHNESIYLRDEAKIAAHFGQIIGHSETLKSALLQVEQVAATDSTVIITGETGTGKELFAHAIHSLSPRRDSPLIKVNCSALPTTLIESELFGHEKGAFTGANARRIGRFELAHGGTIFLDEVGDLPLESQAKLLRVLQDWEFERLGSNKTIKVDVRVVAATNQALEELVRDGKFRADLYFRLSVFPIHLPPLRERREDIQSLVSFFVNQFSQKLGKRIEIIAADALEALERYAWPGNVRELKNVLEKAVILSNGGKLRLNDGVQPLWATEPSAEAVTEPKTIETETDAARRVGRLEEVERKHILEVMEQTYWRVEGEYGAASILGLRPGTLRSRMKKLGIRRPSRRK
jgi:formate hydrogenlyase transcriptional activator